MYKENSGYTNKHLKNHPEMAQQIGIIQLYSAYGNQGQTNTNHCQRQ